MLLCRFVTTSGEVIFTLFLEAKPGEENKTICGDALSLFLPKLLALSKVCNPTEQAGCFWCNRAPPLVAASPFTDGFCHSQTPTDLQSQHFNLNDLLLFIVQDHFQNDSVKWDPFCPCCEGDSAMQISRKKDWTHIWIQSEKVLHWTIMLKQCIWALCQVRGGDVKYNEYII